MMQITGVFVLMASALLAIVTAIGIYIIQPYFAIFKWKLKFEENGEIYNLWAHPPVDLYVRVYLFNITNKEAFLNGTDTKLQVQEVGPYVYKELMAHDNVTFNANGTLSTNPKHPLLWQEHMSEGRREDDILVLPNIALLSIAQVGSEKNIFLKMTLNLLIRQTKAEPLVTMTAREFMFGYESSITTLGNQFMSSWISFDKVGLIDRMYDFSGDFETFFTGESNPSKSGLYDTYRGSQNLPQWKGDYCSNITGASDGTKFESFIEKNDTIKFFRKSLCRPIHMTRDLAGGSRISGLNAEKYVFERNALDNGRYEEKNQCFCRNDKCLPEGLIDVTDCYYGFPIVLSYPHFMEADPAILDRVRGMQPNETIHQSFFHIEPTSGLPLKCSMKFQINMRLKNLEEMAHVERFSDLTVPMLWFDIVMFELPQTLRSRFHLYLNVLPVVDSLAFYGLFVGGVCLLIYAISKVSFNISTSISSPHHLSKSKMLGLAGSHKGDQYKFNVYMPCEEKLLPASLVKCPSNYLSDKNATEMQDINLTAIRYELENEMPLIEDSTESESTAEDSVGSKTVNDELESKVQENDYFDQRGADGGQQQQRTFSWAIEPEMHPDLLAVFEEDERVATQKRMRGHSELDGAGSTENLNEMISLDL